MSEVKNEVAGLVMAAVRKIMKENLDAKVDETRWNAGNSYSFADALDIIETVIAERAVAAHLVSDYRYLLYFRRGALYGAHFPTAEQLTDYVEKVERNFMAIQSYLAAHGGLRTPSSERKVPVVTDAQEAVTHKIGDAVDRLVSVDLSARGFISTLYEESLKLTGGQPLCLAAAKEYRSRTRTGGAVVIATGLPVRGWFSAAMAENDGPIGAATLARAVYIGLRAVPILLCETQQTHVLRACLRAVGISDHIRAV